MPYYLQRRKKKLSKAVNLSNAAVLSDFTSSEAKTSDTEDTYEPKLKKIKYDDVFTLQMSKKIIYKNYRTLDLPQAISLPTAHFHKQNCESWRKSRSSWE